MTGHTVILRGPNQRELAKRLVDQAPVDYVVRIAEMTRTGEQNDKMWAMLGDIARSKPQGRRHTPDDWKAIIMNACGWDCQFLEGLDGKPFPAGFRSSRMTKSQMMTMIDWMQAWGDENGVTWQARKAYA
jgi:NinB protein